MSTENSLTIECSQQSAQDECLFQQSCNFAIEGFHFLPGQLSSLVVSLLRQNILTRIGKTQPSRAEPQRSNLSRQY